MPYAIDFTPFRGVVLRTRRDGALLLPNCELVETGHAPSLLGASLRLVPETIRSLQLRAGEEVLSLRLSFPNKTIKT